MRRGIAAVSVQISPGELIDRWTILRIKCGRIADPGTRANIRAELRTLDYTCRDAVPTSPALEEMAERLRVVNESLWDAENAVRFYDTQGEFGEEFIIAARSIYRLNDERSALKRRINLMLGSDFVEAKEYSAMVINPV